MHNKLLSKNNKQIKDLEQCLHDIKSPIATLKLVMNQADLAVHKKHIINAAQRIKEISDVLIGSFETSKDTATVSLKAVGEINELVNDLVLQKKIEFSNNELVDIYFNSYTEYLDSEKLLVNTVDLRRVVSNLINNAVEATQRNGMIEVTTKIINKELILSIKDNGCGFPDNLISIVGKKRISTKGNKRGLGLTHAFKTVKKLGGHMLIKSSKNKGTMISLIVPML